MGALRHFSRIQDLRNPMWLDKLLIVRVLHYQKTCSLFVQKNHGFDDEGWLFEALELNFLRSMKIIHFFQIAIPEESNGFYL